MARWLASVMVAAMAAAAPRPAANHRVVIPGGPFTQGSTRGEEDERPTRKVTLKAFAIDRTEVTRGEYAACVEAGRCKPSDDKSDEARTQPGSARQSPSREGAGTLPASPDLNDAKLPVTGVDWNEAQAYCTIAGGQLPTDAEREPPPRGHDQHR